MKYSKVERARIKWVCFGINTVDMILIGAVISIHWWIRICGIIKPHELSVWQQITELGQIRDNVLTTNIVDEKIYMVLY